MVRLVVSVARRRTERGLLAVPGMVRRQLAAIVFWPLRTERAGVLDHWYGPGTHIV